MAAAAQQAGPLCGVSGHGRQIRLYVEAFKLRMLQFFWWGPPLYRGKYRRWPLSLFVISGNASGRTYPTPPGGVVHNQEFSLGGQQPVSDTATIEHGVSGGDYGSESADEVAVTVTEDEVASTVIALSVDPADVSEGAAATEITVTAKLNSGSRSSATVVTVTVGTGTATSGTDFTAVADLSLTIAADATGGTGTFRLSPTQDTVDEPDETVAVDGSTPVSGLSVTGTTITLSDTPQVILSIAETAGSTAVEGEPATFVVELSGQVAGAVAVSLSTSDETAQAGADYTAVTDAGLTLAAGSTARTLTVATLADTLAEEEETFAVTLTAGDLPVGVSVGTAQATGRITDDDGLTVSVKAAAASVLEGATAAFTVSVVGGVSAAAVEVSYTVAGTATAGEDYTAPAGALTLAAGAGAGTIAIPTLTDSVEDAGETLVVTLSGASTAQGTVSVNESAAQTTITETEPSKNVMLSISPVSAHEGAGQTAVRVKAALDAGARPEATGVTVRFGDAGDTATKGQDYRMASDVSASDMTVTIPSGGTSASKTYRLILTDDAIAEGDETVSVMGTTNGSGLTVVGTKLTVLDDDEASTSVALSVAPASVEEGAGATAVRVTATLDASARPDAAEVTVSIGSAGDSATENTDYLTVGDLTVTIPSGATSATATFELTLLDDAIAEGEETVSVTGTTNGAGLTVTGAELTIMDDDEVSTSVALAVFPASVDEGAGETTVGVTATLDADARPDAAAVTVSIGAAGDTATAGTDYQPVADVTVRIPAGETGATGIFTLTPRDDALEEDDETISVTGATAVAGLTVSGTELTITDNDDHGPLLETWLGWYGRTAADQVLAAVGERLAAGSETAPQVTLAGHRVPAAAETGDGAADLAARLDGGREATARRLSWRELVSGSAFTAVVPPADTPPADAASVTLWGSGARTQFGGRIDAVEVDGAVWAGLLGVDYATAQWLAGLAVAYQDSVDGSYRTERTDGQVHSWLVGGYPYVGYQVSDALQVWAAGGYGQGVLTLSVAGAEPLETAQRLLWGAAGARGELLGSAAVPGAALAVSLDGLALRSSSEAAPGLAAVSAEVSRARLGLEGSYALSVGGGMELVPSATVAGRYDAGDAGRGFGLDVSGGLRWAAPGLGLAVQVSARGLVVHEAPVLREWGLAGQVSWDPTPGSDLGPSLTVTPAWGGPAESGVQALWGRASVAGPAGAVGSQPDARVVAEAGYGLALRDRAVGTPYLAVGLAEHGRDYRLGVRFSLTGSGQQQTQFTAELARSERSGGTTPEHQARLGLTLRY